MGAHDARGWENIVGYPTTFSHPHPAWAPAADNHNDYQ